MYRRFPREEHRVSTYHDAAYDKKTVVEACKAAGFKSFEACVASLTTDGYTRAEIAKRLKLNAQRFCAYYHVWSLNNAPPLRFGAGEDDA